jgi:NitT/TauT family transport system permease protein
MTALDDMREAGAALGNTVQALDVDPGAPPASNEPKYEFWKNAIPPLITFVAFIGVWYLYSWLKFDNPAQRRNALPYPHIVITEGFMPWWDDKNGFRPILGYMWPTLQITLMGLAISIVFGVFFAVVMNLSKNLERAFFPYAVVLQTVPILAITPLLTQLFGEERGVRLVVCSRPTRCITICSPSTR